MKVRYATRCERCKKPLRKGDRAVRQFGRLWCHACPADYRRHREAMRAR